MTRIDVIRAALAAVGGRSYVEIGVRDGECFHAIAAETRVAVDPRFRLREPLGARARRMLRRTRGTLYFQMTSDAFFAGPARRFPSFDVAFVDGLHTHEQSYRDILNALDVLSDGGVVVVHDCSPRSAAAAAPTLEEAARTEGHSGEWNGEVYKAIARLRTRDDLRVGVLDCDHGVGIVRRGAPDERLTLSEAEIAALTFDDLAARRTELLGLRPLDALGSLLAG